MLSRHPDHSERQRWMGVLARASAPELEALWRAHGAGAALAPLRPAETGLVMVRGRAGGTGQRFNLGEMTVTRCAVEGPGGVIGHGYVKGRDKRHAELAAAFDALLQDEARRPALLAAVIDPLAAAQAQRRATVAAKAATTKVEFFTLVRGE
ncbi:MAG: phosphonate C-P lyase system protein PhnG [Geminicoccaceae bacterium]|nr:MAG: phosphonate C-P lyase system protein PhnG [Geminicoccaceae bacterium]